jgi:hypothetical protein
MHEYPFRSKNEPKPFFIQLRNYKQSGCLYSWGCQCPECGATFEFNTGKKWNFCPGCGCNATVNE